MNVNAKPWMLRSGRVTCFTQQPALETKDRLSFLSVFGAEPDSVQELRKEGVLTEAGQLGPGVALIIRGENRCDLVWQAVQDGECPDDLGLAEDALGVFVQKVASAVDSLEIDRLALGAICHAEYGGREDCYVHLKSMLTRVNLNPADTTDFIYQANHPTNILGGESIHLNRVCKWSAVIRSSASVKVGSVPKVHSSSTEARFFALLELDFNTAADAALAKCEHKASEVLTVAFEQALSTLRAGDSGLVR